MVRNGLAATVAMIVIGAAAPLIAQPHVKPAPGMFSSEARLQFFSFDNFLYSADPQSQETVNALGAEYRGAWRYGQSPAELFAHVNVLSYQKSGLGTAYGGRVGLSSEGQTQQYKVFLDSARNRPVSDLRNAGTANRTSLYAEYAYSVTPAWKLGGDGTYERQQIQHQPQRNNALTAVEGVVRYTGFGWRVTPHAGIGTASRRVRSTPESYKDRSAFAGVEWIPLTPLYLSLDYREIRRSFDSKFAQSDHENHGLIELVGDWHATRRLHWTLYYSRERVRSPLPGQSFQTQLLITGLGWAF